MVIAQNAAAGKNSAQVDQLMYHASTTNVVLIAIALLLALGGLIVVYRMYRRCHRRMVERHANDIVLRRYASIFRGRRAPAEQEYGRECTRGNNECDK